MPINSRQKGARCERELRDLFHGQGYAKARRGQQFCGHPDAPDVIVPELPWLHLESKAVQNLNVWKAMGTAVEDAGPEKMPVMFHKKNGTDWLVTMRQEDWFKLLASYEALKRIQPSQ
jgi:hypothetical protein